MSSMAIPKCWKCGTVYDHPPAPKIKWRGEAQSYFMRCPQPPGYGIADRVIGIADCFLSPDSDEDDDLEWKEGLLEELKAYDVESIDVASVLHSKGRLFSFLGHVLSNKHACILAKAAEVITTMVQNSPMNQQLVIEGNGLQLLLHNFTSYLDSTSRINTLVAISALIQKNKSGITVFRRENGYAALRNALISKNVRPRSYISSVVINLIDYLLLENGVYNLELRFIDDSKVQEAALSGLLLLEGNSGLPTVQRNSSSMMINRRKSCLRISHQLLFPTVKKEKKKANHCSKEKSKPLLKNRSNSSSKRMKLH